MFIPRLVAEMKILQDCAITLYSLGISQWDPDFVETNSI